jgi:hypothetical protein
MKEVLLVPARQPPLASHDVDVDALVAHLLLLPPRLSAATTYNGPTTPPQTPSHRRHLPLHRHIIIGLIDVLFFTFSR